MSEIAIVGAGTAGAELVFKRPLAVLAWGLTFLVFYGLPAAAIWATLLPNLAHFATAGAQGISPTDPALLAMTMQMQLVNLLMLAGSMVARAVVYSAIFRAVLQPEASRFGYVRFGMQEVWVGLVTLVGSILVGAAIVAGAIVVGIPIGITALVLQKSAGPGTWVALIGLAVVALVALVSWVGLRLSLAGPMSFAAKQFRLFESWPLTRGKVWPLLGVGVVAVIMAILFELVFVLVVAVVGGSAFALAMAGGHFNPAVLGSNPAALLQTITPWLVVALVAGCFFIGAASAVVIAPFARVYQLLTPSTASVQAEVFS